MKKIVVINKSLLEEDYDMICEAVTPYGYVVHGYNTYEEAKEDVSDAEIIYGYDARLANIAKEVKWFHLSSAGINHMVGKLPENVLLSHSVGAYGVTLAEYMVMVTLMLVRRMPEYTKAMSERRWIKPLPNRSIKDSVVVCVGTGDIGTSYAKRIRSFEPAKIIGVNRSGKPYPLFDEMVTEKDIESVLPTADIIAMSLPATAATKNFLSKERIALLSKDAYVVNAGRGDTIDQEALVDALNTHQIAGAALDVMTTEPLPVDDPLWEAENVILTPHCAGNLTSAYTRHQNVKMFVEEFKRYINKEKMIYLVDQAKGY